MAGKLLSPGDSHITVNKSIVNLWGGMQDDIIIIHSAWNANRVLDNLDTAKQDTLLGHSLKDVGVTNDQASAVIAKLTRYGNLLVEGDMIAVDHILSLLRFCYDPKAITVKNSWELGTNEIEVKNSHFFKRVRNNNIILVCGPLGNLVTSICLQEAKLSWLIDSNNNANNMLTHPIREKARVLTPNYNRQKKLQYDVGVFLSCKNPFNSQKRMYIAMGIHAYGTQGASALACNNESALELISAPVDPEIKRLNITYIGWVNVWREVTRHVRGNGKDALGLFTDPGLRYKIIWPSPDKNEFCVHKNPSLITSTQSTLRHEIFNQASSWKTSFLKVETILDMIFVLIAGVMGAFLISMGLIKDVGYYSFLGIIFVVLSILHSSWLAKNSGH